MSNKEKCTCNSQTRPDQKNSPKEPIDSGDIFDILSSPLSGILATSLVAVVACASHEGIMRTTFQIFLLVPLLKIALSHFWKSFLSEAPNVAQEEALLKVDVEAHLRKIETEEKPTYLTNALKLHTETLDKLARIPTYEPTPHYKAIKSTACSIVACVLVATLHEYSLLAIAGLLLAKHEEVKLHKILINFHIQITDHEAKKEAAERNSNEWQEFIGFVGPGNSKKHTVEEYAQKVQRFLELKAPASEKPVNAEE